MEGGRGCTCPSTTHNNGGPGLGAHCPGSAAAHCSPTARPPPQSDLAMRLARRVPKSPEDFEQAIQLAEQR